MFDALTHAKAAYAMWSELKRNYVSSEDFRTFDLTKEISSANVKHMCCNLFVLEYLLL